MQSGTLERVIKVIAYDCYVPDTGLTADTKLADLNLDNLDLVALAIAIEEEFDLDDEIDRDIAAITTVGDLAAIVDQRLAKMEG